MRTRVNWKPVFGMAALLGAGIFMSSASAATFVYVGNADSQDVTVLELRSNGDLTPVETAAVPGPAKPGSSLPLAVSPDKKHLYAGLRNEPYSVATFAIDARTGKLTPLGSGPLADSMAYVVTDHSGKFLLSASYVGNKVTVNPIGPDGVVQPVQQIIATQPNAHCIMTDPSNRYVLHTSLGGDLVYQEGCQDRHPEEGSADCDFAAEGFRGQAMGGGHPPDARWQISLRVRTHHQHACGLQRRSQDGIADID